MGRELYDMDYPELNLTMTTIMIVITMMPAKEKIRILLNSFV